MGCDLAKFMLDGLQKMQLKLLTPAGVAPESQLLCQTVQPCAALTASARSTPRALSEVQAPHRNGRGSGTSGVIPVLSCDILNSATVVAVWQCRKQPCFKP